MEAEQVWRYKLKLNDPLQARKALQEMLKDEEDDQLTLLDIEDEFDCPVKGCVLYRDEQDELVELNDLPIHIDYKAKEIKLPTELVTLFPLDDAPVPANNVRYVSMPIGGFNSEHNDGNLVVLSLWSSQRDIVNVHLVAEDAKQAMLLLNAVTRLVFETAEKETLRAHKFYRLNDGPVDVAFCSATERDERDEEKERKGRKQTTNNEDAKKADEPQKEFTDLIATAKFYIFDEEALLLYDSTYSPMPVIDLRFYREQTPKAIDTIFVCTTEQQLEIQQGDKVFFIRPQVGQERSVEAYKKLVQFLKNGRVKPKSEACFTGTGIDYAKIFAIPEVPDTYETDTDEELGDLKGNPIVNALPRKKRHQKRPASEPTQPRSSGPSETMTKVRDTSIVSEPRPVPNEENVKGKTWQENIRTGSHVLQNASQNERMQMDWFKKEAELEKIPKDGIPDVSPSTLGSTWDPQSLEHMCRAVDLTRDCIMTNQYADSLARLGRCLSVFGKTLLPGVEELGSIEIMKRIFFLRD